MVVVACCCCIPYRLALMLAPTFAPRVLTFAPYTLTFAPCAYGVSLLSTGATVPIAQVVVVTSCNMPWWCFILQLLPQIVYLHTWWSPSATCAGGFIYIYIYICISMHIVAGRNSYVYHIDRYVLSYSIASRIMNGECEAHKTKLDLNVKEE